MSPARNVRARRACAFVLVLGAGAFAACSGSDDSGDTEAFCSDIEEHQQALTSPTIADDDDVDELVDLYGDVGGNAPLAIEEEWDALTDLYEAASELESGDSEAREEVKALSFATEGAAVDVWEWVNDNCDVDIGPVSTIIDHDPQPPSSGPPAEGQAEG